jgi:hypothetical protein
MPECRDEYVFQLLSVQVLTSDHRKRGKDPA